MLAEWVLILTLDNAKLATIESVPMQTQVACEKAGKEWLNNVDRNGAKFLCVKTGE